MSRTTGSGGYGIRTHGTRQPRLPAGVSIRCNRPLCQPSHKTRRPQHETSICTAIAVSRRCLRGSPKNRKPQISPGLRLVGASQVFSLSSKTNLRRPVAFRNSDVYEQPRAFATDTRHMPRRRYHSVVLCPCPRFALCEPCRSSLFSQLRGVAANRGGAWADRVALEVRRTKEWPPHEGRAADIARRLVRDLARDPLLLELLAAELARWAAKRWATVAS